MSPRFLEHAVLLSPSRLARAVAGRTGLAEERWMLHQPRSVRASYARAVLRSPDPERAQAAWLLRQPDGVRESYVRDVLGIG